jgi:type II secretory pathway pseudopilin PulG
MVEIALALAVLAIGMSSILVLFPVGVNANKSAIADNNLADIGEYLMGYLRAGCSAEWAEIAAERQHVIDSGGTPSDPVAADFFFSNKIATDYSSVKDLGETSGKGIDPLNSDYDKGSTRAITDNLYLLQNSGSTYSNSAFLYKQTTGDILDFAAVVKVWKEAYNFYTIAADGDIKKVEDNAGNSVNQYATVLCVEISYPAQAPYAQREKRLFRQEIFNEAFRY